MAERACHVFGSATQVGLTQVLGGMRSHHGMFLLAIVAIPILLGLVAAFEARFRRVTFARVVLLALLTVGISFAITLPVAIACSTSWDISLAAPKLLTTDELQTLRRTSPICPTVYKFKRSGQDTCLLSDGDGGAAVGCG